MRSLLKLSCAGLAVALWCLATFGCSAELPGRKHAAGGTELQALQAQGSIADPPDAFPARSALAEVDGSPIYATEVLRLLYLSHKDAVVDSVRQLVLERVVEREARRENIGVDEALVEGRVSGLIDDLRARVLQSVGRPVNLEEYIPDTFGISWPDYLSQIHSSMRRSLLAERAARFELGRHERVQLRLIRLGDRGLAEEIRDKLARGADFATLARSHSEDGSAAQGGLYPPLPLDLDSTLISMVAEMADGELSAVTPVEDNEGRRQFRIVQRVATLPARRDSYVELRESIESELADRAISSLELDAWIRIMGERHGIAWYGMGRAIEDEPSESVGEGGSP